MKRSPHTARLLILSLLMLSAGLAACNLPLKSAVPTPPIPTYLPPIATPTPTTSPPTAAYTPVFEPAPCQFYVPEGHAPECGYLVVPEDRARADSPLIRLHVAIFRSSSPAPAPDPVIHLTGGPGSYGLTLVWYYFSTGHDAFLATRDYVVFDQRGVGFSQPALDCPEANDLALYLLGQDVSAEVGRALEMEAYTACRDRLLGEGIDLAAYHSAASAADVSDLRIALGYDEVNLLGVSYGTRLALTVMRDHPEGIRSVILDSAYPPQVNLYTTWASNAGRAFDMLFDACAADADCSAFYPDLRTVFYALVDHLNADPITVVVSTGDGGVPVVVDGDRLMDVVFMGMYRADVIPALPHLIYEVNEGSTEQLAGHLPVYLTFTASTGMRNSVQCREEVPFSSFEDVLAESAGVQPQVADFFAGRLEGFYGVCEMWGAGQADPVENQAVVSDIPALVLAGEFDPITPPEWGELAAATLSNSTVVRFPGVGHWVLRSGPCGWEVALDFLDDPERTPDASCVTWMGGPDFR